MFRQLLRILYLLSLQAECRRYDADAFFKNWDNVFLSLGSNRLAFGSSRDKAITRAGSQGIAVPPDDLGKVFRIDSCRFRAVDEHKGCSHVMAVEFPSMLSSSATEFFAFDDRATRDGFFLSLQVTAYLQTSPLAGYSCGLHAGYSCGCNPPFQIRAAPLS